MFSTSTQTKNKKKRRKATFYDDLSFRTFIESYEELEKMPSSFSELIADSPIRSSRRRK